MILIFVESFAFEITFRDPSLIIWIVYSLIADASSLQGTLGKKILEIKVVSEDGARITIRRSMARNLFKLISYSDLS